MKKIIRFFADQFRKTTDKVRQFFINLWVSLVSLFRPTLCDCTGELATDSIGAIIVAVVIVGLLIAAINKFFPTFFTSMFTAMSEKLNANWQEKGVCRI